MKRRKITRLLAAALLAAAALTGCGGGKAPQEEASSGAAKQTEAPADGNVLDLTKLSSTMVYSEVFAMVNSPDSYIGRQVKMSGNFAIYQDLKEGVIYYACVIPDATACCSQGIEFVLQKARRYPEEYPELGSPITVEGIFSTYETGGNRYCTLVNAKMEEA